eukprot:1364571-Lingulodinium_polyedra.AAC.1
MACAYKSVRRELTRALQRLAGALLNPCYQRPNRSGDLFGLVGLPNEAEQCPEPLPPWARDIGMVVVKGQRLHGQR